MPIQKLKPGTQFELLIPSEQYYCRCEVLFISPETIGVVACFDDIEKPFRMYIKNNEEELKNITHIYSKEEKVRINKFGIEVEFKKESDNKKLISYLKKSRIK